MFEFIGVLFVIWIIYKVIKVFFFGTKANESSQEFGKETRYIVINELKVPEKYYYYVIMNHIEGVKSQALVLRDSGVAYRDLSWPRLMACVIYAGFRYHCEQCLANDLQSQHLLHNMNITEDDIIEELRRNPEEVATFQAIS